MRETFKGNTGETGRGSFQRRPGGNEYEQSPRDVSPLRLKELRTAPTRDGRAVTIVEPGINLRGPQGEGKRARRQEARLQTTASKEYWKGVDSRPRITPEGQIDKRRRESKGATPAEKVEHQRRVSEQGCVVRSLASILGAEPTYGEWQDRFKQIDNLGEKIKGAQGLTPEQRINFAIEADEKNILNLIANYDKHDSPLGQRLRAVDIESHGTLDQDQIRELIASGKKVALTGAVVKNGEVVGRHMVHVTIAKRDMEITNPDGSTTHISAGQLVAKSDGNKPINLSDFGKYNTLSFSPTKEGESPKRAITWDHSKTAGSRRDDKLVYPGARG